MAYYRLYYLDGAGGRISGVEELEAATDAGAVALAGRMRGLSPMELWCGDRKVRRWPALRLTAPVDLLRNAQASGSGCPSAE